MNVEKIVLGSIDQNCYLVWGQDKKALVIDPGDEKELIKDKINENSLDVEFVINTHGHWDHTGANSIAADLNAKLLIHDADAGSITDKPDGYLNDGQDIKFGESTAKVIYTPGHTEGSICLLIGEHLFSGDTLFFGSIGRTDLPGGSTAKMVQTLLKIKTFDKNLIVHPGHGPSTSMQKELDANPYLTDTSFLK